MGNGKLEKEKQKKERLGEINYNNSNNKMMIIEYNNALDIKVQFENGFITETRYECFINGEVKSPYDKTIYGVGYFGEGKFKANVNDRSTQEYSVWHNMMERCYSKKSFKIRPTYIDCNVCEEWHNYQVFAEWYNKNYYQIDGETMDLDKDILYKDNKIYSPETCIFAPHSINNLFVKSNVKRGDLPIGVYYDKTINRYKACYGNGKGQSFSLGNFSNPKDAFYDYKKYKESIIKEVADKYKEKIPLKLYEAMYRYEVEITD